MIDEKTQQGWAKSAWEDLNLDVFKVQTFLPPPRFNGVPCEHYRKVKQYQRELEQGGYTDYRNISFEGRTPEEMIQWAKALPAGATFDTTDYEDGIRASWEVVCPLSEHEVAFRKAFIEAHPVPEGEPDPVYLKWKRSVPFDAQVKAFVEGETYKRGPYWKVTDHPLSEKDDH